MKPRLRILLICHQDLGGVPHPVPAYRFWREYFHSGLEEAGHQVIEINDVDWASGLLPRAPAELAKWQRNTWEKAVAAVEKIHRQQPIDLLLGYLYPNQILPAGITRLRELGIPTVNFFCDNVREFRTVPAAFRSFDLNWVPEFEALKMYRQAGLAHLHAPMACWISPTLRQPQYSERSRQAFIGRRDELRAQLLAQSIQRGLAVDIIGPGWTEEAAGGGAPAKSPPTKSKWSNQWAFIQQHGLRAFGYKLATAFNPPPPTRFDFAPYAAPGVADQDYWRAMLEARVCLGINRYPSPRHPRTVIKTYSRLRDIEAPMAGACYLTEWTEGIDHLYDCGREIETYRNAEELVEKVNRLEAEPETRLKLRQNGQKRALADHTLTKTMERICAQLDLG